MISPPPGDPTAEPAQVYGSQPIEVAWTAAGDGRLLLVLVTTRTLWEISGTPPGPHPDDAPLYVTVVGRQWWNITTSRTTAAS